MGYRHTGEISDADGVHAHRQAFLTQTLSLAEWAHGRRHVFEQPLAIALGRRLLQVLFQEGKNAVEATARGFTFWRSIEEQVLLLSR